MHNKLRDYVISLRDNTYLRFCAVLLFLRRKYFLIVFYFQILKSVESFVAKCLTGIVHAWYACVCACVFSHEEYFISLKRNITEIDCSISIQCALKFDASERRYHDLVFLSATNIFLAEYSTFLMIRWI